MKGLADMDNNVGIKRNGKINTIIIAAGLCFLFFFVPSNDSLSFMKSSSTSRIAGDNVCPIPAKIAPGSFDADNTTALAILHDNHFRQKSIEKLSGAIQVDTVVFDNPPEVDANPGYFEKFKKFHKYLQDTFPTVYEQLEVDTVNTYGLVFTWKGSNESLKPILLTAHQDVVPVQEDSLHLWTYPPFDGHYDGKYLYGRGATDCKNLLIAILESFELLISKNFKPNRTIIAAFGFDEESGGMIGAKHISKYLEEKYGKDSIYALIDEGTGFMVDATTDLLVGVPSVAEKGHLNINAQLLTPGGHSSAPPAHTSIGIASELIYLLENNPFEPLLTKSNPVLSYFQCIAANFGELIPTSIRDAMLKADYDPKSNQKVIELLDSARETRYLVRTSQAVDIIRGGEKENALPESVFISVNHRIAIESSIKETLDRFLKFTKVIARKHNLGLKLDNKTIIEDVSKDGTLYVSVDNYLEPTPAASTNDTVWKYLTGSSRHLMHDLIKPDLPYDFLIAPMLMPANTDTRHYHSLTKNIFRYSPGLGELKNIHSIDEYVEFDHHLHLIAFFFEYLQTIDTPEADN